MELGSIERDLYIDAAPEVVFDVVSDPDHVKKWWPDDARYEAVVGSEGEILFGDPEAGTKSVALTVVEMNRPTRFAFRWTHVAGEQAVEGNSLLVTFDLAPKGGGTLLTFRETGFREMGWEAAALEQNYQEHANGWNHFLRRLAPYAETLTARS